MREKYTNSMKKYTENAFHKVYDDFEIQIGDIESILDLEEDMLATYCAIAQLDGKILNKFTQMAIVIISKNIDYIYASFKLTQIGQYAAARTIFRNIYESSTSICNVLKSRQFDFLVPPLFRKLHICESVLS